MRASPRLDQCARLMRAWVTTSWLTDRKGRPFPKKNRKPENRENCPLAPSASSRTP